MTSSVEPPAKAPLLRTPFLVIAAFALGVLLTLGVSTIAGMLLDDSRSRLTLRDVITDSSPGFEDAADPSAEVCGDRSGCIEGIQGDGVSIYRFQTLDLARQYVIYSDADFYRSDRLVIEFEGGLTPEEQFWLLQTVEGTWTRSDA